MRLLIFAIFAISAIITIEGTQPNSKRDVWLLSLIIPMLSAFTAAFFAWCLFTFKGSYFTHLSFNMIVCYIPTVIYLHANLKKKLKTKENFKYNAKRYLTIASILGIIGFVYGIIYVYNENETEKKQEHELSVYYYEYDKMLRKHAQDVNKNLPQDLGNNITLKSCKVKNGMFTYIIECKGVLPSDITEDVKQKMREKKVLELKYETKEPNSDKYIYHLMNLYKAKFAFDYINEKNEQLCSFEIPISEVYSSKEDY